MNYGTSRSHIYVSLRFPKEKRERGRLKKIFQEIMAEIFQICEKFYTHKSKLSKPQAQEHMKETTPKHTVIKLLKTSNKEKNLESNHRKKDIFTFRGIKLMMTADFLLEKNANKKTRKRLSEMPVGARKFSILTPTPILLHIREPQLQSLSRSSTLH